MAFVWFQLGTGAFLQGMAKDIRLSRFTCSLLAFKTCTKTIQHMHAHAPDNLELQFHLMEGESMFGVSG